MGEKGEVMARKWWWGFRHDVQHPIPLSQLTIDSAPPVETTDTRRRPGSFITP